MLAYVRALLEVKKVNDMLCLVADSLYAENVFARDERCVCVVCGDW
jgi:hypothetical protein